MDMTRAKILGALAALAALACIAQETEVTPWQPLFDGKFPVNFRGYKMTGFPVNSWGVRGGTFHSDPGNDHTDLLLRQALTNFEFSVEWRVGPGANSGIVYLVQEGPAKVVQAGLKMTLADDHNNREAKGSPLCKSGSLYGLLPARNAKPCAAGQWHEARLLVNTNHVEHWLNGDKVLEYNLGGRLFKGAIPKSRFKDLPEFGEATSGFLVLEHNSGPVSFRKLKLRVLPSPEPVEPREPDKNSPPGAMPPTS